MKKKRYLLRCILPFVCLLYIACCRFLPVWAESYARTVYPVLSAGLSAGSSVFSFSLEEPLIIGVLLWAIAYPFWKRRKGQTHGKHILYKEMEVGVWMYIWFYLGWGLNYFRYSVYVRAGATPVSYEEQAFREFLTVYADSLNASFVSDVSFEREPFERELKAFYRALPASYGLALPHDFQRPKNFTFTPLYSGVGVLGSVGPFFAEAQLNADLLPLQIPFTYAHELSHLLGVSNEAEANYWAYRACVRSGSPAVRHSGYVGILSYVLANASRLLPEDDYREWVQTLRPEVRAEYERKRTYWAERHNPWMGAVQDRLYDWFLKGNRIPSGRQNYAEVIGILLTLPVSEKE